MEVLLPLLIVLPAPAVSMIALAMGFGMVIVGCMFMVAYALQNPQMIAMAREELAALVFTAIIILFWVGSDALFNTASNSLLISTLPPELQGFLTSDLHGGLTQSHINVAYASLALIEAKLKSQYLDLYLFEALIGFLSTISFPLGSPVPAVNVISFSLAPFTGLALLSNAHTVIVESIGYLVTVVWAKQFILIFARDTIPIIMFPFGLVLRTIPLFRRTGSSVIAIAFAMYFAMPFAMILSNYLIFDMFKPVDFVYTPATASYMKYTRAENNVGSDLERGREGSEVDHMLDEWMAPSVVEEASNDATDDCAGNLIVRLLCSAKNIVSGAIAVVGGFLSTVWNIWRFMVGMTGDFFFTGWNNPLMPASASAGLFHFVMKEVALISPFIILVMITTIFEIIITVTSFRGVSLLIGGEAELIGLTKVV